MGKNPQVANRIKICKSCEHLNALSICNKCKCFMPAKVRLMQASCPLLKWMPAQKP